MSQTMNNIYVFATNGSRSSSSFLRDPFLPVNIASRSDQYDNIQLVAIFGNNGVTCPFYTAIHSEQLFNATTVAQAQALNTLDFFVPANHPDAQYVTEGNLVAFRDLDGNFQLFEIMRTDGNHDTTLYKEAYCVATGQSDLTDDWISNRVFTNVDATTALAQVLDGTQWMVGQVDGLGSQSMTLQRTNVTSALAQLVTAWGGEMRFRVVLSGRSIAGMYVDWLSRRGSVTGKRFVYGKDLSSVQKTSDVSNLKTALHGYGKADANQQPLTFADVEWSTANGNPVNKPTGQDWVGDPNALSQWGRQNGTRHRFGSYTNSNQSDATQLLQETWNQLQTMTTPLVSYQMSVVDLERISGYSFEAVRIGDTVAVIDNDFTPALRLQARVLQIDRDLLDSLNTTITLGNFLPTVAKQSVQVNNLQQSVTNLQTNTLQAGDNIQASWLVGVMDLLKAQIQSEASYVYVTNTDGILVLNAPQNQNPTKAIKLGGGIVAIANSKDANGNWNWSTFGTGDGFIADFINAGTLNANLVNVTNLNASNIKTGTLDASVVTVTNLNANNIKTGTLNAINVTGSSITGSTVQSVNGNNTATLQNGELDTVENNVNGWNLSAKVNGAGLQLTAVSGATTYHFSVVADPSNGLTLNSDTGVNIYGPSGIFLNNNTTITGNYSATGTKSAVVKTASHGTRKLYAMESPEIWFEDFGEAQTDDTGRVTVPLEAIFAETVDVSKTDYKVFVQGVDTADLRVSSRTPTEFTVVGTPNATFMYRLVAKRLGFADIRLERHDDKEV